MMPDWEEDGTPGRGVGMLAETAKQVEKPPLFKVLLHNDDFTSMEFVVDILQQVFRRPETGGAAHHAGSASPRALAWRGFIPYEIAEAKVNKVSELAGAQDYPLLCTLEQE